MLFTFTCDEHKEFGGNGWRLKSQPDFDPLGGMGVAHDCLDHFTDSADPADEFLALGASMFIRDYNYYVRKGSYATEPGEHIASDLPEILRHVIYEGYRLPPAPRTCACDIEDSINAMFASYRKELQNIDDKKMRLTPEIQRSIRSYLRIGYRRARRRYRARNWDAQQLFTVIEDAADKALKYAEIGAELRVNVNFRDLTAKVRVIDYPEDDY